MEKEYQILKDQIIERYNFTYPSGKVLYNPFKKNHILALTSLCYEESFPTRITISNLKILIKIKKSCITADLFCFNDDDLKLIKGCFGSIKKLEEHFSFSYDDESNLERSSDLFFYKKKISLFNKDRNLEEMKRKLYDDLTKVKKQMKTPTSKRLVNPYDAVTSAFEAAYNTAYTGSYESYQTRTRISTAPPTPPNTGTLE